MVPKWRLFQDLLRPVFSAKKKKKKKKKKPQDENTMSASATQGGHNELQNYGVYVHLYSPQW